MRTRLLVSMLLAAVLGGVYWLSPGGAQGSLIESVGLEAVSVRIYGQRFNHGFPSMTRATDGSDWVVYVSARPKQTPGPQGWSDYSEGDNVFVRRKRAAEWSEPLALTEGYQVNYDPQIAEGASGNLIAVWSSRRDGRFSLYSRRVGADLSLGSEIEILPAGQLETDPDLLRDETGRLWLAAQSRGQSSMDIVFYAQEGSGWRRMAAVSKAAVDEFRPNLALGPDGSIWCTWDAYENGKYRVKLARYERAQDRWGDAWDVPGDGMLDAYAPDVGVDSAGRVWVTYARNEGVEAVHGRRGFVAEPAPRPTIRAVVRDTDGRWTYPASTQTDPGLVHQGDLPRLVVGSDDRVWIAWQFFGGHVAWKVAMGVFDGARWTTEIFGRDEDIGVEGPLRRADQLASFVLPDAETAEVAYQRGTGTFLDRDIYLRSLRAPGSLTAPRLTPFSAGELEPQVRAAARQVERDPVFGPDLERYQLYFGDLHNHLLVDDGHEGSVDQLFNFHRDRFGTDFGATTSHGDSNKLLYSELAVNDALAQAILDEGRFVTIPGFEWTQGDYVVPRAGHRHVIYEQPGAQLLRPTEGFSDSIRELSDLLSRRQTRTLMFAHHISRPLTAGTDWSYVNTKVEPAAEIVSSWGRFEYYRNPGHIIGDEIRGCSMQDVWKMGIRIGVIGGSDGHNLFGDRVQGLTAVYSTELSRAAIFDAILKRRVYATTGDPIELDFRVNGQMMGSEITASEGPLIEGWVRGARKLLAVEVVKYADGVSYPFPTVYKADLDGGTGAKIWWRDTEFDSDSLYYLRVTQEADPRVAARYAGVDPNPFPTEMAWTSPVWVDKQ